MFEVWLERYTGHGPRVYEAARWITTTSRYAPCDHASNSTRGAGFSPQAGNHVCFGAEGKASESFQWTEQMLQQQITDKWMGIWKISAGKDFDYRRRPGCLTLDTHGTLSKTKQTKQSKAKENKTRQRKVSSKYTQPLIPPIPRYRPLVRATMMFINSFPVLVAILLIATTSSVKGTCSLASEPCVIRVFYAPILLMTLRSHQHHNFGSTCIDT
ncbi:hypothetical protein PSHT_01685 [Puccinia striiformis]|uniref:Uncharacterized protein n=2 Tax=Puccinia striiformis TaxID=27350 RepID=A0A2S4WK63_9BASI|nr:hypothetical protein PSHT_01685 [Puccinia striiformis]